MKRALLILITLGNSLAVAAQDNHVFSGSEASTFTDIDLSSPPGQTWTTDRTSTPGYFSAVGTADYIGGSDASHINGYAKHYADAANQAWTFPVGNGSDLRSLSISGTIPAAGTYAAAWISGDPGTTSDPTDGGTHDRHSAEATILGVSNIGQWDFQDVSGDAAGVTVTVSLPDMTTFATRAGNLRLVGWNGSQWVNLSGTDTASGLAENSTLRGTLVSGITAIGIGSLAFPLPVTLIAFNARVQHCTVLLDWQTGYEKDLRGFSVEKSSDGSNFQTCGYLAAKQSPTGSNYTLSLQRPEAHTYYRLKMLEDNGSFSYSPVRSLRSDCDNGPEELQIYPNPVISGDGQVTIRFRTGYEGPAHIRCTNTLGQELIREPLTINRQQQQSLIWNTSALATGTFYISITDASGQLLFPTTKLVKM